MTRNDWLHKLYDALGVPHTNRNAWAGVSWIRAEGGEANWNPLNTTQKMPGSTDYNSVGVQEYPDFETGLAATVKTITQTNPELGYAEILHHLRRSDPARQTLKAVEASSWGTGGLALEVLPSVREDYEKWASVEIPH